MKEGISQLLSFCELVAGYRRSRDLVLPGQFLHLFDVFGGTFQLRGVNLRHQPPRFGLKHHHYSFGRINIDDGVDRPSRVKMHESLHKSLRLSVFLSSRDIANPDAVARNPVTPYIVHGEKEGTPSGIAVDANVFDGEHTMKR